MKSYENRLNKTDALTENRRKFSFAKQEVEHIIDKMGLAIEDGIKETVAILRAMNFPTSSSCAGHTDKSAFAPPYVEIYVKAPTGWRESKEKQAQWREENMKYRNLMESLLDEYYEQRNISLDSRLHVADIGIFGGFRLQAIGTYKKAEELGVGAIEDIFAKIKAYQKEVADFTGFLKLKFLGDKAY